MKPCKQCGYQIVAGGQIADRFAQVLGFCGVGCQDVYLVIRRVWSEALETVKGVH